MASPEEITPILPETLPEDFSEWDGNAAPAAQPVNSNEWEAWEASHPSGEKPKTRWQSADRDAVLESLMDRPRVPGSSSSGPVVAKQQKNFNDWENGKSAAPKSVNSREWEAWEATHSSGKAAKPQTPPAERVAGPAAEISRNAGAASSATVKSPKDLSDSTSPAAAPAKAVNTNEWNAWEASHSFGKTPKPFGQPSDRAAVPPQSQPPRDARAASPSGVSFKPQKEIADPQSKTAQPVVDAVRPNEWKAWDAAHTFTDSPKPRAQSSDRNSTSRSSESPRDTRSAPSASFSLKPQKFSGELVDGAMARATQTLEPAHAAGSVLLAPSQPDLAVEDAMLEVPAVSSASAREADKALFQLFTSKNLEAAREQKAPKKKWIKIAALSACWVLLPLLVIPFFYHGAKSTPKPSVQPAPVPTATDLNSQTPKPSAGEPYMPVAPAPAAAKQQPVGDQPNDAGEGASSPKVSTQMMNDQLTAPTRIPEDVKNQSSENAPPPVNLDAAAADGLGGNGANDSFLNGRSHPAVKAALAKPIAISSGVATGMLIQKTAPVYPPIARSARVAGTVQLHAIISKSGSIKDLQVVSGPEMLRQAAVDAVRTWRYRPYKLNNEPTEVETTINVIFSLGG